MAVNGSRKGKEAEREVAAKCEAWWLQLPVSVQETVDRQPARFVRTPQSGGWSTRQARASFLAAGDLCSTSRAWPFTVEVKRREAWSISMFVKAGKVGSPVWAWWEQCVGAAEEEGGVPMLWMRRSKQPWLVLLPDGVAWRRLGLVNADIYWADPEMVAHHNTTGVHPMGFLADKLLASDPASWLGLRTRPAPAPDET